MKKLNDEQICSIDWQKLNGLVPAIVQDFHSGQVLMLGYMNEQAIIKTQVEEKVTFFSRSKNRLWTKGESSENYLHLKSIAVDCDNDALLIQAVPDGPTCHLNTPSCWDEKDVDPFLLNLIKLIEKRKQKGPSSSYTRSLFESGTKRIAQKVGEEGVETALAAATEDKQELINEASDLIFHLLVLLEDQELSFKQVINRLDERRN
ncbi:bifunctional phosphoribosyl-AMP cyclohydrolase/phosphoribosyl-ATP diphosphatase HisIE [Shewanella sp. 202IG2-18]|uniref:bifunctional phosphoribosyl-AMP cyclohydrolase/phosphoribosyl-ATP diphosphatase HisIE n=1 Tax=Parashewanella hymeniacidonis TaxID=2807618 RepID=UPI0019609867|nr:bifunctional phosphoribosyl-AMP cyclohydrolase/phosphoribosyl-ATP diphosphatase HisIE [Parashewanella hymeniacidonis]MBM7072717.1 bifunctional phosphoribosyl-AMP cyclohydrolase/phosphoribosyl-ATP diphosphatase HisIE [Parashewanella hymeniacidonis]